MRRRRLVGLLRILGLAAAFLIGGAADPVAADNCSGLSDCYFVSKSAVTVTVGLGTVAVVLLLAPPIGGSPDVKPFDPGDSPKGPSKGPRADGGPPEKVEAEGPKVKVVRQDGVVVEVPTDHDPAAKAEFRVKVQEAEQAVEGLPKERRVAIFRSEASASGNEAAFEELATAIEEKKVPGDWARLANPTGDRTNAAATVRAVDAGLAGVPRVARGGGALTSEALAKVQGSTVTAVTSFSEVDQFLAKVGPGGRGVVAIQFDVPASWANATPVRVGHAFNVANLDGQLAFVDGQVGVVAGSADELLAAAGVDPTSVVSIRFTPTNPPLA